MGNKGSKDKENPEEVKSDDKPKEKKVEQPKVGFTKLFRFATPLDIFLILGRFNSKLQLILYNYLMS